MKGQDVSIQPHSRWAPLEANLDSNGGTIDLNRTSLVRIGRVYEEN